MDVELEKYYKDLKPAQLVEIIDSINTYRPEVIEYCKQRLSRKKVSKTNLKQYAKSVLKKRFYNYFVNGDYLSNEIIILESFFMTELEAKECFKESKQEYIKYIEGATSNLPSG